MAQLLWVRMDCSIPHHPKILELVNMGAWRAISVWHFAVEWSGQAGMGGFIPHHVLPVIHARKGDIQKLVTVGLCDVVEGGYQLHNYGDRNLIDADSLARSQRAAKAAQARWKDHDKGGDDDGGTVTHMRPR